MIDKIEQIDRDLLIWINNHNSPLFDEVMWQVSHQLVWIPLFVFFLYYGFKKFETKQFIFFILGTGLCFLMADRISVMAFKDIFMRYRPTHNLEIQDLLHVYLKSNGEEYRGGLYGFVSSHSANFFALSTYLFLLFKHYSGWWKLLFVWALLIVYSRMYLGVHYPLDIIGGSILGFSIGLVVYKLISTFTPLKSIK